MTSDFMKELLSKDEKITVEYKNCQYGIQEDVYETVCSFSNRYGGYIIMGVEAVSYTHLDVYKRQELV